MNKAIIAIMVEKKSCFDNLEEILSLGNIDMVQFGACDFSMSIGLPGQRNHPKVKQAEIETIKTAIKYGVRPRVEIGSINFKKENIKYYIDLGVKDFHMPSDIVIIHEWIKENSKFIKKLFS